MKKQSRFCRMWVGVILMVCGGCASTPRVTTVEQWGAMKVVLRQGKTEGRVALAEVSRRGTFAVGALEGLKGEITVLDGEAWIARAPTVEKIVGERTRKSEASATLLLASDVDRWQEVVVGEVGEQELDAYVAAAAEKAGVDTSKPFPFVVEGEFAEVELHVIRGGCPIANPDGPKPARVHESNVRGKVVGFFARDSSGDMTHHTSDVHAHVILDGDGLVSGHIDSVRLKPGNVLRLPVR